MSAPVSPSTSLRKRQIRLTAFLLVVWAIASFGLPFWAHDLSFEFWGWPIHFWVAAQGAFLMFLIIVAVYAWLMNHWEAQEMSGHQTTIPADPHV